MSGLLIRPFMNASAISLPLRESPTKDTGAISASPAPEGAKGTGKNIKITEDDARELAKRALQFKNERGRVPDINSADAWEKRMAEGVAAFARYRAQAKAAQAQGASGNG